MTVYYLTYSMMTDMGLALGRSSITCAKPINSMTRVEEVEKAVLDDLRATTQPSARSLFLTWWRELEFDRTDLKSVQEQSK